MKTEYGTVTIRISGEYDPGDASDDEITEKVGNALSAFTSDFDYTVADGCLEAVIKLHTTKTSWTATWGNLGGDPGGSEIDVEDDINNIEARLGNFLDYVNVSEGKFEAA